MKLYHVNGASTGFLKVSVSVPNSNEDLLWQTHEVNQFSTSFVNDPEIREFRLDGATNGTFKLRIRRFNSQTLQVTYNHAVELNFDADSSTFNNALK